MELFQCFYSSVVLTDDLSYFWFKHMIRIDILNLQLEIRLKCLKLKSRLMFWNNWIVLPFLIYSGLISSSSTILHQMKPSDNWNLPKKLHELISYFMKKNRELLSYGFYDQSLYMTHTSRNQKSLSHKVGSNYVRTLDMGYGESRE